jgi:hypothetical protein
MQPSELVVLHESGAQPSDLNLIKLAVFLGIPVRGVPLATAANSQGSKIQQLMQKAACVAVSASTLRRCLSQSSLVDMLQSMEVESATKLFVYGFRQGASDSELIRELSGSAFSSVRQLEARANRYCVSKRSRAFCQEFCGLTFGTADPENDSVFQRSKSEDRTVDLIRVGGGTFLAGVQNGASFIVLSGARQILDIDATVAPGLRPLDWFSQLVPALMFLRYAFEDRCWRPGKKLACFIVDDPLLRARYGFLRYDSLLEAMERSNFATNLAFVPWNYNRSSRSTAELFLRHPKRFSLSIHGCDHTKREFDGVDEVLFSRKADIARKRMERHRELTGISFDNVMVFPQGVFSSVALKALKTTGYLGAVNSTPFPVDDPPHPLRVRDLLTPAVTCYSGFPLFIRHYPNCIADFALDLFLGKPALIVEHHDYFRSGYGNIQEFAAQINRLREGITWCGLEEIVRNVCLVRRRDDGTLKRQFYCNEALAGSGGENGNAGSISTIGNDELSSTLGNADFRFGSRRYRIAVSVRRHLCEFRDNYVSRSRIAMAAVRAMRSEPKDSANRGGLEQGIISITRKPGSGDGQNDYAQRLS